MRRCQPVSLLQLKCPHATVLEFGGLTSVHDWTATWLRHHLQDMIDWYRHLMRYLELDTYNRAQDDWHPGYHWHQGRVLRQTAPHPEVCPHCAEEILAVDPPPDP